MGRAVGSLLNSEALASHVLRAARGRELLVAVDFDGTISDLVPRPRDAQLRDDARVALETLARRTHVVIVSGRGLADLRARVTMPDVSLVGEHGGELLLSSGERHAIDLEPSARAALIAFERDATELLEETAGEVEAKRLAVAAHTRRVDPALVEAVEGALLERARERARAGLLEVLRGKCVVELRARGACKALGLARARALLAPASFVVSLGDDATDEDLFRESIQAGGLAIKVGDGVTVAHHRLAGPPEVARFLVKLALILGNGPNPSGLRRFS